MSDPVSAGSRFPELVVGIGNFIEATLSTQWVVLIVVPVMITIGAIALKYFSRKSRRLEPADFLVGFDLGMTACLTLMVAGIVLLNRTPSSIAPIDRQHYVVGLFVVLILYIVILAISANATYKYGWTEETPPVPKRSAMILVNVLGVILLIGAYSLTGGTF